MRAKRLLSIIMLLQSHHRLTTTDLAHRLDVSERTIQRDMDVLSSANIPVYSERGRNGGWQLVEGYRSSLIGLTSEELSTLILTPSHILQDLGLDTVNEIATLKLLATLPKIRRTDADKVRERVHVDGASWHGQENATQYLADVQCAIWNEQIITITYQRTPDTQVERTIAPLGLVIKGRIWYLIAMIDEEYRTYRISRIKSVIITDKTFIRPSDFDLAHYWEQTTQQFKATLPEYIVTLHVKRRALHLVQSWRFAYIKSSHELDADMIHVEVNLETLEDACAVILACGGDATVQHPLELKTHVKKHLQQLCETL
ncbi:MAG: YafY family protein [Chloroflexota bacterium]